MLKLFNLKLLESLMAKITISRLFEISQYLTTKAGQELRPALAYISEFAEVTLRNLRNGLTFSDNLDCEIKQVSVRDGVETIISIASKRRPSRIYIDRIIDNTFYVVNAYGWKFNSVGDVVIKVKFDGTPSSSLDITLNLVIFFG